MKHLELFGIFVLIPHTILSFFNEESPRWLMTKGRMDEAKEIIKKILKWNKLPESNLDMVKEIEAPLKRATITDILRKKGMRRNLMALGVCWMATAMGYYGLVFNTPSFLCFALLTLLCLLCFAYFALLTLLCLLCFAYFALLTLLC
jgi:hypothetical protein